MEIQDTTPNRLNWQNLRAWTRSANKRPCPRCNGRGKVASKLTCPTCLGDASLRRDIRPMILRSKLQKVGGLLRIRDDYEPVWRLANDADGKAYIVRATEEDTEDKRVYVAEDESPREETPVLAILTVEQASARYGEWATAKMASVGVTRAREDLLERWASQRKTAAPAGLTQMTPGMAGTQTVSPGAQNLGNNVGNAVIGGPENATDLVRGWNCPMCEQPQPGGSELREHMRKEHGVVDGD